MSQGLAGPSDHRHHQRGGHDQPLRPGPAEALAQPEVGGGHQSDEGDFEPVGPGGPEDAVE
jgi:hypothetical protein